jgi:uncharacterized coiled-coil protein SlyX
MPEKSLSDQINEITKLLADSQHEQEQAQFALRTLLERVEAHSRSERIPPSS